MKATYRDTARAVKPLEVLALPGRSEETHLKFSKAEIRYYRGEIGPYFFARLAVPGRVDDEGYVLELSLIERSRREDDDVGIGPFEYEAPLQECTFEALPDLTRCVFEEMVDRGQYVLVMRMTIKGSPFNGYVFIEPSFYRRPANRPNSEEPATSPRGDS